MITFFTRYMSPTNRLGSRTKVWSRERPAKYFHLDHAARDPHLTAVQAYIDSGVGQIDRDAMIKYGWTGKLMKAEFDRNGFAFIPVYNHHASDFFPEMVSALEDVGSCPNKNRNPETWLNVYTAIANAKGRNPDNDLIVLSWRDRYNEWLKQTQ